MLRSIRVPAGRLAFGRKIRRPNRQSRRRIGIRRHALRRPRAKGSTPRAPGVTKGSEQGELPAAREISSLLLVPLLLLGANLVGPIVFSHLFLPGVGILGGVSPPLKYPIMAEGANVSSPPDVEEPESC
ncbi:Hypothetical protein NTJ_05953 [Nesidiocoris tenuis]|uniref:Uncharacterized protein n=1 Tax=Nesidiocoris tenuis TaxID=355587 RepID=A0ABN7ALP4_9HEMI|nr:Hypothetical protein NTJ_05953 [Nesidiocoris tenuis]